MKNITLFVLISFVIFFSAYIGKIYSQVTDKDGNVYKTVTIGKQEWTTENLTVEHYRNGDAIPQVQDAAEWANLKTGAWCYYENDSKNGKIYGKLYNWYAVNDPRGLTPEGWHIASDAEWKQLIDFSGGEKTAGKKLKDKSGWFKEGNGTNESGFTSIPGGIRDVDGSFYDINKFGCFWTSSENSKTSAWYYFLIHNYTDVARFEGGKERGLSIRSMKD